MEIYRNRLIKGDMLCFLKKYKGKQIFTSDVVNNNHVVLQLISEHSLMYILKIKPYLSIENVASQELAILLNNGR